MAIRRRFLDVPDYTLASLDDITEALENCSAQTEKDLIEFKKIKDKIEKNVEKGSELSKEAVLVKRYVQYWMSLLEDFQADLKRILDELPGGVEERHLEALKQIHERSLFEQEQSCSRFEEKVIENLNNQSLETLADEAFELAFQGFYDNVVLVDLGNRLRAFIGSKKGQRTRTKGIGPLEVPQGSSWGDISIRFLDGESVEIRAGRKPLGAWNFAVLGFEDKRAKRPDQVWQTLWLLGLKCGEISWETRSDSGRIRLTLQKNISILRKRLKALFALSEDPFFPYDKANAYKAKFNVIANEKDA
ncbi:MAG: hypothetical protein ABSG73_01305 [Candidatus Aminicenantales bacterium]|jgi:hypothetical protein